MNPWRKRKRRKIYRAKLLTARWMVKIQQRIERELIKLLDTPTKIPYTAEGFKLVGAAFDSAFASLGIKDQERLVNMAWDATAKIVSVTFPRELFQPEIATGAALDELAKLRPMSEEEVRTEYSLAPKGFIDAVTFEHGAKYTPTDWTPSHVALVDNPPDPECRMTIVELDIKTDALDELMEQQKKSLSVKRPRYRRKPKPA